MRVAVFLVLLAGCYAPVPATGVPCSSDFECPGDQVCNRALTPPICNGTTPDAGADGTDGPLGAWSAPVMVMAPLALEDDPTLTADTLECLFNRDQIEIWRTTRAAVGAPWSTPELVVELGTATTPELTADGLTVYFASSRLGSAGADDIWVATRPSRQSAWTTPERVAELSSLVNETNATPSYDHLTMLVTRRTALDNNDNFISTRASTSDAWDPPSSIPGINSSAADGDPMLSLDGLELYFYSTRPGSAGGSDLWITRRTSPSAPLGPPEAISELNTPFVEQDPWISPDGRTLVFASDRSGQMAIWQATR